MCSISIRQQEICQFSFNAPCIILTAIHGLFKSLDNTLCKSITRWVVRCCLDVFYAVSIKKSSNSLEVNCGPLSLTIVTGSPFLENMVLRTSIVRVDVVVLIFTTSGHFEFESTIIRNIYPRNGPAKSM